MEFTLPEADTEVFCRHLMGKYDLENFFATLSKNANVNVHNNDFGLLVRDFPTFWTSLGFSLRDIDYCVRTIALVGKNIKERQYMYPSLLGLLIALKLMNPSLYRLYIERKCLGSEVMNYIYEKVPYQNLDTRTNNALNLIEGYLYLSDKHDDMSEPPVVIQLKALLDAPDSSSSNLSHPEYLSERTLNSDKARIQLLINIVSREFNYSFGSDVPSSPSED